MERLIPWFGSLNFSQARSAKIPVYMGESGDSGFEISVRKGKEVYSWEIRGGRLGPHCIADYLPLIVWTLLFFTVLAGLYSIGAAIIMAVFGGHSYFYYFGLSMLIAHVALLLAMVIVGVLMDGNTRRYHAVEHMTFGLLGHGFEPNAQNLAKMPKLLMRCGSSHFFTTSILLIVIGWAVMTGNTLVALSLTGLIAFLYGVDSITWIVKKFTVFSIGKAISSFLLCTHFYLFGFVAALCVIPPIFEYSFYLREPGQKEKDEALMLAAHIQSEWQKLAN